MFDRFRFISVPTLVRWMPIIILLLAAYWRFDHLTAQSLWNDEGNSLSLIQQDYGELLNRVSADIHPPAYYILLKIWTEFTGLNEFGLRSLSVFWGVLAVAFTYALGGRLYSRAAGILAALLVAVNPFAVYYSQETRMYAQLAALSVISLWLLSVLVMSKPRSRRFTGVAITLALVNALGLYTQYTYPFTMIVQGIFFVWYWVKYSQNRESLIIYVAANLLTLALFAPWLPTAYDQITTWGSPASDAAFSERLKTILTYITFGNTASNMGFLDFLWIGLLFAVVILPDWYPRPPSNYWRVGLPLVWISVICGALLVSGAYREANLKFLLPAQIGVALLVGRGAYLLWDSGSGSAAVPLEMAPRLIGGLAFFMVFSTSYGWLDELHANPAFQRDDYRSIAAIVEANTDSEDAVILNAPGQLDVFGFYYDGDADVYPLPRGLGGDDAATMQETLDVIDNHHNIYVVFWGEGERDPNSIVKNTLDTHAYEIDSQWFGNVRLGHYGVLATPPDAPTTPLNILFGDHIMLEGYAITGKATAGDIIGVTLFWQTDAPLDTRYKVFVQLLNPDGFLVSQHDTEPANNRAFTTDWQVGQTVVDNHGIPIPADVASGDYTIIVGIYELDNPSNRLSVNDQDFYTLEKIAIP